MYVYRFSRTRRDFTTRYHVVSEVPITAPDLFKKLCNETDKPTQIEDFEEKVKIVQKGESLVVVTKKRLDELAAEKAP